MRIGFNVEDSKHTILYCCVVLYLSYCIALHCIRPILHSFALHYIILRYINYIIFFDIIYTPIESATKKDGPMPVDSAM